MLNILCKKKKITKVVKEYSVASCLITLMNGETLDLDPDMFSSINGNYSKSAFLFFIQDFKFLRDSQGNYHNVSLVKSICPIIVEKEEEITFYES